MQRPTARHYVEREFLPLELRECPGRGGRKCESQRGWSTPENMASESAKPGTHELTESEAAN